MTTQLFIARTYPHEVLTNSVIPEISLKSTVFFSPAQIRIRHTKAGRSDIDLKKLYSEASEVFSCSRRAGPSFCLPRHAKDWKVEVEL